MKIQKTTIKRILLCLWIIIILGFGGFLVWMYKILFQESTKNLFVYLNRETLGLFLALVIIAYCTGLFIWMLKFLEKEFFNSKSNWWPVITLVAMILVLLFGILIISNVLEKRPLELFLRDSQDNLKVVGNITCEGASRIPLVGDKIICYAYPVLNNVWTNITFTYKNNSDETIRVYNLGFYAPADIKSIRFQIEGIDQGGSKRVLEISNVYTFLTANESEETDRRFLSYIYALLAIILFSIPSSIKTIRDLIENR